MLMYMYICTGVGVHCQICSLRTQQIWRYQSVCATTSSTLLQAAAMPFTYVTTLATCWADRDTNGWWVN